MNRNTQAVQAEPESSPHLESTSQDSSSGTSSTRADRLPGREESGVSL